jgi:hypothetical protein
MKDIEVPRPRELLDKPRVAALLPILERQLKMDRSSGAHDSADITELPSTLWNARSVSPIEHTNLAKWHSQVSARPSDQI